MKRFTKAISMLLAIVMVIGLLPLSIIAEDIHSTHTVQFKLNYNGAHKIPSQKVADGECAVQPEDVTREGWIFEYWYVKTEDNGIQKFDLSQPITEDVTLYARWDEDIEYWGPIWNRNLQNRINNGNNKDNTSDDSDEGHSVTIGDDIVYRPSIDNLVFDIENCVTFYNNLIIVFTFSDLSKEDAEKLAAKVDGKVVGDISGAVNMLQILVSECTYDEICTLVDTLEESEDVLYASYDIPMYVDTASADSNPWSNDPDSPDKDRGNEANPSGNDWWAEAIGAYTAWNYSGYINPINVGIIDNGFATNHEDLRGNIEILHTHTTNVINGGYGANHGTNIAGVIAAHNNDKGIRGIADFSNLICVDFDGDADDQDDTDNIFATGEFTAIINQLIMAGCCVINNSWYMQFSSIDGSGFENWCKNPARNYDINANSYALYGNEHMNTVRTSSEIALTTMVEAMLSGYEDFIIVQCAGNGMNNSTNYNGVNAQFYSGFFTSITETLFERMYGENDLVASEVSFSDIADRLFIVGAVAQNKKNNNYYMTNWSCYGSTVNIAAFGENVLTTDLSNRYGNGGGTSIASPMVTGAVAFVWAINSELSANEVHDLIINSCTYKAIGVGSNSGTKYPLLNVGAAVEAAIEYSNYKTISGHITDEAGTAIKDTTIKLTLFNDTSDEVHVLDTDNLGYIYGFSDSDVIFTKARIEAVGYEPKLIDVDYYINNNYSLGTIQLAPEKIISAHITGNITDISDNPAGVPMVGDVKFTFYKDGIYQDFTYINDGVIDLTWVIEGNFKFVFEKEGYDSVTLDNIQIKNGENSLGIVEMKKSEIPTAFSITHTYNNVPTDILAASPIEVYNGIAPMTWTINSSAPWKIVTNRGDWFSLSVEGKSVGLNSTFDAGKTELKLNISKYTDSRNDGTIEFAVGDETHTVEIFQKAYCITGTIVAGDTPVSGAQVFVSNEYYTSGEITTGEDGKFSIRVPNAWYDITINTDVYGEVVIPSAEAVDGKDYDVGVIDLAPIAVSGTITIDGKPVSGAEVTITNGTITMILYTDENGNYYTNLPEGWYTVSVAVVGYAKYETTIHVTGSSSDSSCTIDTIVLEIRELLVSATGIIVDSETGELIEDVDVNLVFTAADDGEITNAYSTSMADGTYRFDFFEEGTCSIEYSHPEYTTVTVEDIVITADSTTFDEVKMTAKSIIGNGECGDNLEWILYDDYTLVIKGTGEMWDYAYESDNYSTAPWSEYGELIKKAVCAGGITSIGKYAFYKCIAMEEIDLPNTIESIGNHAFQYCSSLLSVSVPAKVRAIEVATFEHCSSLSEIILPDTLTSIGNWAFSNCGNLAGFDFPEQLEYLGENVFWYSEILNRTIYIPAKLNYIGSDAFAFTGVENIYVDDQNTMYSDIDGVLFNKDKTILIRYPKARWETSYTVPQGVVKIGSWGVAQTRLTEIILPSTLEIIGYGGIWNNSLNSLIIPESVTEIHDIAFEYSSSLKNIYFMGNSPTVWGRTVISKDYSTTINYIAGNSEWTSPTWTAPDGTVYNTATWDPENTN